MAPQTSVPASATRIRDSRERAWLMRPARLMVKPVVRSPATGRRALWFREIQLHADAVGIIEEELRVAGARHDAFAEFDVLLLQALAHAIGVGGCEGDVVEPAGILVFLLGAPDHDALAWFSRAHQVHGGHAPGIEPVAREIQRRSVAVLEAEHVAIELLGALKVGGLDGVVLQGAKRHGFFLFAFSTSAGEPVRR